MGKGMKLTRTYIMKHRTDKGAWTKPQIEALGIDWPPRKGWINRVINREIDADAQKVFESKIGIRVKRKNERLRATESLDLEALNNLPESMK